MPSGETVESGTVVRNGLAALLTAVVGMAVVGAAGGRQGLGGGPTSHTSLERTTWQPALRAAAPAPSGGPAALVLMRGERLSIRSVAADDLRLIDGIGPRRARELIAARRAGALESVADVDQLPGFGPRMLSRLAAAVAFAGDREER